MSGKASRRGSGDRPWFSAVVWRDIVFDAKLADCSDGAFRLWMKLCSVMAERSDTYGHLDVHGRPMTERALVELTSVPARKLRKCMAELEARGRLPRTPDGVIFCRRMVEGEAQRQADIVNGRKGGNPDLLQVCDNPAYGLQQNGSNFADEREQNCKPVSNENNALEANGVNPPVKAESDSDSEIVQNPQGTAAVESATAAAEAVPGAVSQGDKVVALRPVADPAPALRPEAAMCQPKPHEWACFDAWNEAADGHPNLKPAVVFDAARLSMLRHSLRHLPGGARQFVEAVGRLGASPVFREDAVWTPDFEWFLENRSFLLRTLEGGYDTIHQPRSRRHAAADPHRHGGEGSWALDMLTPEAVAQMTSGPTPRPPRRDLSTIPLDDDDTGGSGSIDEASSA